MKRDLEAIRFQLGRTGAFGNENSATAKSNQPTHADPEESTTDQNSVSFAAVLNRCSDHIWA
jgi:hypothetical protein